jgi:hypothetical protein
MTRRASLLGVGVLVAVASAGVLNCWKLRIRHQPEPKKS